MEGIHGLKNKTVNQKRVQFPFLPIGVFSFHDSTADFSYF